MDLSKQVISGSLPFRPAKSVNSCDSQIASHSPSATEIMKPSVGETPRSQSSEEVTNSDTEQLSVDQRISIKESENPDGIDIMDSDEVSTLIDKSGNVLQNEDQTAIGGHPDDADKPASGPIIEDRATRARQENKPLQYNVKKPDNDMTTEVTDEIPDIEKLPYGVQPNPDEERVLANMQLDIGVADKKKKKNKKRPKTKRGMDAPTGFEPFFADAPLTPAEFEEIKKVYDPTLPFHMRFEEAIKRFLFKRRLEPRRRHLFLKYLQYGGVNTNQKYGQGVSPQELKDMSKEEAMEMRNFTMANSELTQSEDIAFDTVAKGYLGGYYIDYFSPDNEDEIKLVTGTIKNFLTFLLYHDVCPEYQDDIENARKTCDLAAKEVWEVRQVVQKGPGSFNQACSMLFGGNYFDTVDDPAAWENVKFAEQDRMTQQSAREVLMYAMAGIGPDERAIKFKELAEKEKFEIKEIDDIDGFEIVSIEQPTPLTVGFYEKYAPNLKPVGVVRAKEFRDPAKGPFNLSKLEEQQWKLGGAPRHEFEFFMEGDLLAHCFPGMKALTKVFELNCDIHFFDEIMVALPSFYTFLNNDLMIDYKVPKPKEPTDKWVNMRAEHRKAMDLLAGPKLSRLEQARVLLKDLTIGADYDAAFGTRKLIPADNRLGFEYDVVPQPGVPPEREMGIIAPRYENQKMIDKEEAKAKDKFLEEFKALQGDSTDQMEPKKWWTPEEWWGDQEWYGLVKDWKPKKPPAKEHKQKFSLDQLKEDLRKEEEFIQDLETSLTEATLTEYQAVTYFGALDSFKAKMMTNKLHVMQLEGTNEPPGDGNISKIPKDVLLERSTQLDGPSDFEQSMQIKGDGSALDG